MADVKWIKIITDIFDDEKILLIEGLPDKDSIIVIWFKLLCLAGKQNNNGVFIMNDKIAYTDEMLSTIFRRPINTVRLAITTFEQYGMIEVIDGVITIPNWGKHQTLDKIEKKNEYQKEYMREYREKQKQIACKTNSNTNSKTNVSPLEKELELDKELDKDIKDNRAKSTRFVPPTLDEEVGCQVVANRLPSGCPSIGKDRLGKVNKNNVQKDALDLFERLWVIYPNKKGKGQVSDARKKKLYEVGEDELLRAINRYKIELDKDTWRKPQNGSTFFNSGYIDYLDSNYVPGKENSNSNCSNNKTVNMLNEFYDMADEWVAERKDGNNG